MQRRLSVPLVTTIVAVVAAGALGSPWGHAASPRTADRGTLEERGVRDRLDRVLPVADPEDPSAVRSVFEALGIKPSNFEIRRCRCPAEGGGVVVLLPRGRVRLQDVETYLTTFDWLYDPPLEFVLSHGGAAVDRGMFAPEVARQNALVEFPLAASLQRETRDPLGAWTLSIEPKVSKARFTVVPDDPAFERRLAAFDRALAGESPLLRAQVRAQALLNEGLVTASFRTAWPEAQSHPRAGQLATTLYAAIHRLGLYESWLDERVRAQFEALPASMRELLAPPSSND